MRKRFTLSTRARQDLKEIKDCIACDNLDQAEEFLRSIAERFQQLADFPGIEQSYEELFPNLRGFPVGNYMVFYHRTEKGISISRILSGYHDLDSPFLKEQNKPQL